MLLAAATGAKAPAAAPSAVPVNVPAQQVTLPAAPVAHTWVAEHLGWLTHSLAGLAVLFAVALVVLLAIQTTKQEGLSGTIGGRVESAYRSRPGMEESLKRLTGFVAVSLVVVWAILSLTGI